jgi:hypothetical protein
MKRFALYLPVVLVGLPLLVSLLLASAPSGETASAEPKTEPLAVPVPDKGDLPDAAQMEKLAREDPVRFLENCLRRYQREVKGYTLVMQKQERLHGKLYPKELMEVCFQDNPHSVYLHWLQGARKAERVVFVAGENNGKMLVHPAGIAGRLVKVVERDVTGADAKDSGRYTLDQFGIANGTRRTLKSMQAAQKKGTLRVEYKGEHKVVEAGNRVCYTLHRSYEEPENDGVTDLTIYIDKETWLQVGSVVKAKDNKVLGDYYFRDIRINPEFKSDQFTRAAVAP